MSRFALFRAPDALPGGAIRAGRLARDRPPGLAVIHRGKPRRKARKIGPDQACGRNPKRW